MLAWPSKVYERQENALNCWIGKRRTDPSCVEWIRGGIGAFKARDSRRGREGGRDDEQKEATRGGVRAGDSSGLLLFKQG